MLKFLIFFFDVYHQERKFCLLIILFIFAFGFGISLIFVILNKKFEKAIFSCDSIEEIIIDRKEN